MAEGANVNLQAATPTRKRSNEHEMDAPIMEESETMVYRGDEEASGTTVFHADDTGNTVGFGSGTVIHRPSDSTVKAPFSPPKNPITKASSAMEMDAEPSIASNTARGSHRIAQSVNMGHIDADGNLMRHRKLPEPPKIKRANELDGATLVNTYHGSAGSPSDNGKGYHGSFMNRVKIFIRRRLASLTTT